jgi:hypothetical protein
MELVNLVEKAQFHVFLSAVLATAIERKKREPHYQRQSTPLRLM